jgi:hypothetical protein
MKIKHTPGNWQLEAVNSSDKTNGIVYYRIHTDKNKGVAFAGIYKDSGVSKEEAEANAKLIVTAVNNHHALVDALKLLIDDAVSTGTNTVEIGKDYLQQAKKLLQQIEQENIL